MLTLVGGIFIPLSLIGIIVITYQYFKNKRDAKGKSDWLNDELKKGGK